MGTQKPTFDFKKAIEKAKEISKQEKSAGEESLRHISPTSKKIFIAKNSGITKVIEQGHTSRTNVSTSKLNSNNVCIAKPITRRNDTNTRKY